MARQIIKLKRSNVPGNQPTAGDLEFGELAINTTDGNVFFEREGTGTIEQFITTTPVTGSIDISGSFSFKGPFLIRKPNGDTALSVSTDGYVTMGEYTGSLDTLTPDVGTIIFSGSEFHLYS